MWELVLAPALRSPNYLESNICFAQNIIRPWLIFDIIFISFEPIFSTIAVSNNCIIFQFSTMLQIWKTVEFKVLKSFSFSKRQFPDELVINRYHVQWSVISFWLLNLITWITRKPEHRNHFGFIVYLINNSFNFRRKVRWSRVSYLKQSDWMKLLKAVQIFANITALLW